MDDQTMPNEVIIVEAATNTAAVSLGESVSLVFFATNQSEQDDYFDILVQGIPLSWLILDLPVIHLSPGERREVSLTIQAPGNSPVSIGSYPLTIQVVSQQQAALRGETVINLQIKDYLATIQAATAVSTSLRDHEDRLGLILHTTQFSCAPGETLSIPIVIVNRGAIDDTCSLGVTGLPSDWFTVADPVIRLTSGSHRDDLIYIHPPFSPFSRAGRHPFTIQLNSQNDQNQGSAVDAQLTITGFGQFSSEISPQRINAGQTARLLIHNLGNYQDAYTVGFQITERDLEFVPTTAEPVLLMPGETGGIDFAVSPKSPNWFGSPTVSPFFVLVQPASGEAQRSRGEVISRSLVPVWIIAALAVMCLSLLCGMGFLWNWNQSRLARAELTREAQVGFVNEQTATADFIATTIADSLTATAAAIASLPTATGEATPTPEPTETPVPTVTETLALPTETLTLTNTVPPPTNTAPPPEPTSTIQPTAVEFNLPVTGEQVFVFSSNRAGSPQLFLLNSNQGEPVRLTDSQGTQTQAVWSPDGNRIAYTSDQDGNNEIYLINADGTNALNLTQNAASDSFPTWSPEGSQLAFVTDRDGNNEIYVINIDGEGAANLSNDPANDYKPAWYSQSSLLNPTSRILFTSDRDGNNEIFAMNTDGSEVENLTNNPGNDTQPAVPYNGGQAAFVTDRDGNLEIYVMDLDGGNPANITRGSAGDTKPVWSRDGAWIAFTTDRDGNREIYIVRADGETPTNVSRSPDDDFDPTWR